jgi:hypothetical protein
MGLLIDDRQKDGGALQRLYIALGRALDARAGVIPPPGSDAAIRQGSACPILANAHDGESDGRFVVNEACRLHRSAA